MKRPLDHKLASVDSWFGTVGWIWLLYPWRTMARSTSCGEGLDRTWTIKDKLGNAVSTQKIIVKHRSDFEVIFPADKKVTCDRSFRTNRTDTSALGAGKPILSDDDCEQLGVTYKDEIFTMVDSACYKIVHLDYNHLSVSTMQINQRGILMWS